MSPAEESKLEGTSGATEGAESSSESTSSSAAKSEFSAEPADLAATSSAVPKTSTQQQAAPETPPAQSNPPISKPTNIPASQAPTPKASSPEDQLKTDQTTTQVSDAAPKTSTQQQAAPETPPAQSNPPISKPTNIPASQAPTPNQEQNKVGKEVDWPLLAGKARDLLNLSNWIKPNDQSNQWQQLRQILVFVAWPIALVIFVRIYGGILSTIERVPLASSLFEMAGIIWLAWFSLTRLIRSKDRQDVISSLRSRWHAFSGSKEKPDSPSRDTVAPPQ
jgi:hypothetical protein